MQSLGRVLAASGDRNPFDDRWYQASQSYGGSAGGGRLTADSAMTIPAFYAAVSYIAEDTAKVPLGIYEDLGEQGNQEARNHELHGLLHDQPNRWQSSIEWREFNTATAMLRGRCVNELIYGGATSYAGRPVRTGALSELRPLHPDLLRRERVTSSGDWKYLYRDPLQGFKERTILAEDTFVVPGRHDRSVLEFAATSIGTELARERYAGFLFSRGARHQGVITSDKLLPEQVRKSLRKALSEYSIDGPRAGRPLLLEDGLTWQDVSMTPHDAQLLEMGQYSVAQVCRWIRIQPHKVFEMEGAKNASIAVQLSTDYVVDSLLGWCERWEQAIWMSLIVDKKFFAKHNLDGLLRGDPVARAQMYALAVMWGWMTRNEVRRRENMNPLEGLDDPLTPGNMTVGPDGVPRAMPQNSQDVGGGQAAALLEAHALTTDDMGLLRLFAADAAGKVVRREIAAMSKLAERTAKDDVAWRVGVDAFYVEQVERVAGDLHLPEYVARGYTDQQRAALHAGGPRVMSSWLTDRVAFLTERALDQPELAGAPRALSAGSSRLPAVIPPETYSEDVMQVHFPRPTIQAPDVNVHVDPTVVEVPAPDMTPVAAAFTKAFTHLETVLTRPRKLTRDAQGRIDGMEG